MLSRRTHLILIRLGSYLTIFIARWDTIILFLVITLFRFPTTAVAIAWFIDLVFTFLFIHFLVRFLRILVWSFFFFWVAWAWSRFQRRRCITFHTLTICVWIGLLWFNVLFGRSALCYINMITPTFLMVPCEASLALGHIIFVYCTILTMAKDCLVSLWIT